MWLASNSHEWIQPPLVGTHENLVENQKIKCTEINKCEPTAAVKQTLLPTKSVPSFVPSSQSIDSTLFVDKANPEPPAAADPEKPNMFKRNTMTRPTESFDHSPQSLQKSVIPSPTSKVTSAPSRGKIRTGRKRPSGHVNIGDIGYIAIDTTIGK